MSQRPATSTTGTSSASAASNKQAATKSKAVFNPYAKKKSTTSLSVSAAPSSAASTNSTRSTNGVSSNNGTFGNHNNQQLGRKQSTRQSLPQPRSPPPVHESTTFIEAFGDIADRDAATFGDEDRAEQAAFEANLASLHGCSNNGDVPTTSDDNSKTNNNNGITPRDHHTMLQPQFLHISTRQRGNPILSHIRNVPYQFSTMVPDYIFAPTRCALFLSLRYHNLHPNYIHRRVAELKSDFEYRMLLCYVDIEDNTSPLLFLNDLCVQNNLTLLLAWSEEEAARYLEAVKYLENSDASFIQPREFTNHPDQVAHALGAVRSVNKTDAAQLLGQFGSFRNLARASVEELSVCPGVGPKKVKRLREVFHRPFSTEVAKRRKEREKEEKEKEDAKKGEGKKKDTNDDGSEVNDETKPVHEI